MFFGEWWSVYVKAYDQADAIRAFDGLSYQNFRAAKSGPKVVSYVIAFESDFGTVYIKYR